MESKDKYQECFERFEAPLPDEKVSIVVKDIIDKKFRDNYTHDVLKKIYGCIDLTSLNTLDSKETIWQLVERVNKFEDSHPEMSNVAAICTYPVFTQLVKEALMAKDVKIASVAAGFPSSQTFPEIKIAEVAMAVMSGADEIDVVLNLGNFMEDAFEELTDELNEIKDSCREAKLKVILETGALATAENIQRATILSLYSGADFIKTSTGKGYPGASLEAVYTISKTIKTYHALSGNKIGIKISGGIRTAEEAVKYYTIVKEVLGDEWLSNEYFRIGASNLVMTIEKEIE